MNLSSENARAMLIEHITNKKIHVGDGSTADSVFAQWAKIAEVVTDTMKTKKLYADEIDVGEITADNALLKYLQCVDGVFQTITSDAVNTHIMSADEVNAAIGTFIELNADKLFADYIKATDIVSETITVDQLFGVAAKFFSMIAETVTATGIVSYKIDSEHLNIKDAFIKDAMIDTLSAGKIKSGSLDTGLVTVQSSDGRLKIQDNTLLISDAEHTRVQIGKDATGDYNMILCDASGKVMWNAAGLQPDAIKDAIIVDDMVSDTANINAKKLNISSIITAVNADTTKINATSIVVDADNQTLSAWFKSTEDWKSEKAEEYTQLESKYEAVNGRFENYLSKTEFVDISNDVAELKNQYTDLKQTTDSITATVSQTSSDLNTLQSSYTSLTADVTGFKTEVSSSYVSKSAVISSINQTAETIKINASKIDITGAVSFSSFDAALQNSMTTVTNTVNSWGYSTDKTYIDGSKIYTGTITADKIAAGAITADKIVVGESDNLITVDPCSPSTLTPAGVKKYDVYFEKSYYGKYISQPNISTTSTASYANTMFLSEMRPWAFKKDDVLYFEGTVPNFGSVDATGLVQVFMYDSNKKYINSLYSSSIVFTKNSWNIIKTTVPLSGYPSDNPPYYYIIGITKGASYSACRLGLVQGAVCKRKFNGQLIVNGSITATQIAAGSITADKLKVTDLKAIGATIGGFTIGATYIANGVSKIYDASKTEYVYVGTDGISCGHGFRVTKTGQLVLTSTVMSSTTGGTRTAICTVQSNNYYTKIYPNGLETWNAKDNYYAFVHPDQIGFFEYNSTHGKFECHTWLGSGNAIIGSQLHVQGICYCAKDLEVSGKLKVYNTSGIELYGTVPYIDFHYNNGGADYTARIIAEAQNTLTLVGGNGIRCATGVGNGYIMHGRDNYSHKYGVSWDGTLRFYVDSTNVGNISDRRLKKDIEPMHDAYLQAVGAVDIVQYKVDRTIYNDDINFGAIAQDLRKSFTDHGLCPDDYKLLGTMQDTMDDPTLYYTIDYEQFLIARVAYDEKRTDNLEQQLKDYQSDNAILRMQLQQLQHQLDALTVKVNAE